MSWIEKFSDIIRADVSLAEHTWLKVGGRAQWFATPRSEEELRQLIVAADQNHVAIYVLGGGSNLLVRESGVPGLVLKLDAGVFGEITVQGTRVRAGGAAQLSHVISQAVEQGLSGLETLVGIPGTVAGAVKGNAGGRHGEIGEFVKAVTVMTAAGEKFTRSGDELTFEYRFSGINELLVLGVELELKPGDADEITRRMRQLWITKKASQPFSFQSAGCVFKNPRGLSAGSLIDQAGLKGTRSGQAEVSDRHANFIVTNPGATADDVLALVDIIQTRVREHHGIELELEIRIW